MLHMKVIIIAKNKINIFVKFHAGHLIIKTLINA